jgi:uncharacterized protein (DUF433 family)
MATVTSWTTNEPNRCGGDACVRDTRNTVWGLEAYRRLAMSDQEILAAVPGLTAADLKAAWEYVAANPSEIDNAIRHNDTGDEGFVE